MVQERPMHSKHYIHLAIMTVLMFIAMYILMYAMVDRFENVFPNINQFYMDLPRFRGQVCASDQVIHFELMVFSISNPFILSFGSAEIIFSSRPARI